MFPESGGWRKHLERKVGKPSVRVERTVDSSIMEGLIKQKRKLVKKKFKWHRIQGTQSLTRSRFGSAR